MSTLKDELASLKIDQSARAGGSGRGGLIAVIVILAVIGAGGWFWSQRTQAAEVTTAAVATRTGTASPGAVLNASGYVTARRRATVSSKVTGKVLEVFVEEGQAVREGQVLARLDDSQVRAALGVAEAQLGSARSAAAEHEARLREAELTLGRRQLLLKEGVIGRAELDTAQAEVDSLKARIGFAAQQVHVAESQVVQQQTNLADMVVRAPFDGVAISKDAQAGEMISPVSAGGGFTRTGIGTIVDMSSLEVEVDVSESYINRVRPGQLVEAVLDAYPDWRIPAHVITTVPSADRQKATVRVRIGFGPEPGRGTTLRQPQGRPPGRRTAGSGSKLDPRILPDMGVKVGFFSERAPDEAAASGPRILVPKSAIRADAGKAIVFVLRGDRVERRAVTAGIEDGDQVEVLSGLSAGELVVVEGPPTLADGARVKVKEP